MEQENRKRGREEGEDKKELFVKNAAKKQDVSYTNFEDTRHKDEESESYLSSDKYLALEVFDFPWLHEHDQGIISILSEDYWNFQDTFSYSLDDTCTQTEVDYLYEIPTFNSSIISFPDNKFEESVDCIWSSLLNQPLQQGVPNV